MMNVIYYHNKFIVPATADYIVTDNVTEKARPFVPSKLFLVGPTFADDAEAYLSGAPKWALLYTKLQGPVL